MSAFIVSKKHIASIVKYYQTHNHGNFNGNDAETMANRLMAKNVASVKYRYHDEPIKDLPGVTNELAANVVPKITLSDLVHVRPLKAIECLKAVNCLSYQSCELPDWYESEEYKFLQRVKASAVNKLPGYDEAPWGID